MFASEFTMQYHRLKVPCAGCGLALEEPPEYLRPSDGEDDEVAYDLVEWPPEDRVIATDDLVELGIAYRWEDGMVLVVPAGAEEQVDALLDEIDENAAGEAGGIESEEGSEDGGEEAAAAMSDLFIAADDLSHGAFDGERVADFSAAAAAVAESLPPYGVEPTTWGRIQREAGAVVAALEQGAGDDGRTDAVSAAKALRDLLRHYV
jgi:hypothetical protein